VVVLYLKVYHVCEVIAIEYFREGGVKMYEKFALLLEKNNKTTYRVSVDTGIPQNVFSNWKTGRSKPKADKLKILADYFGVSIEYFLE
jgi:hypothetical protein